MRHCEPSGAAICIPDFRTSDCSRDWQRGRRKQCPFVIHIDVRFLYRGDSEVNLSKHRVGRWPREIDDENARKADLRLDIKEGGGRHFGRIVPRSVGLCSYFK